MTELNLELDHKASQTMNDLMNFYNINNRADLISKAIYLLKIAAHIDQTHGELFARKGDHETKIILR
ncbi:MAG: hypothetical protein Q8936_14235 [Bacillota bacterium]|nr:hypothetical protein [Bacillota bacterium]